MSRFFAAGSESESESSSEDDEVPVQRPTVGLTAFQFSDDEEETRRVVRSAKDKRFDEIKDIIKVLKNHKKIKDMANVLTDFENLGKSYDKAKKVIEKEGIPRFYIRCLVELEDFVNTCWEDREGRKAMSKNNAKGLTTLRQKLKKYCRDFESQLAAYRENPDDEDADQGSEEEQEEEDSDEDQDSDVAEPVVPETKSKFLKAKDEDDDEESDSDRWSDSDEDSSSLSEDDDKYGGNLALKFLKKTTADDDKKKDTKKKEKKAQKGRKIERQDDDEGEWEAVKGGAPLIVEKPKMFAKDTEINHEAVQKKLSEIVSARGKKGTDRTEQIELLEELHTISNANNLGPAMSVKIMFNIVAAIYDYNPNIATCMKAEMWELCTKNVTQVLDHLIENPDIIVGENVAEESESVQEPPYRVRGCVLTIVERMDEEFTKMLQACDAHSTEYVTRLKDEQKICDIIDRLNGYLEGRATTEEICRAYLKKIQHLYYKFEHTEKESGPLKSVETMNRLCTYIYAKDSTDRIRTIAILCHIYHHALHDRWYEARDLMLMSHLQDTVHHADVPLQIQYNRTMVQLGLCAFRQGMIKDAHNCLVDIQSGGRAKELLAQGLLLQRQHERTPEQEKIEKRRQMPYHMHINLELLECVYLVSAMLLEIPYMAAHEFDARRRMISKNFHHVLRVSERQPLVGPPESMREHVVAASKAMKIGEWKQCKNYILNEKMNAKVWSLFVDSERVAEMITTKIQEESLRTYLFTYSSVYDSLSLTTLSEMFELGIEVVHSIISKMIINEELMASLDEPTQTVIMHRTEPTRLQYLALQLSEKVTNLVENNERIMEMKQGSFFYQKQGQQGQGFQQNRGAEQQNYFRKPRFNREQGDDRGRRPQYQQRQQQRTY